MTSSRIIHDVLLGVFLSLVAAYMFCIVAGIWTTTLDGRWATADIADLFIGGPVFALAFTFWLVVPIGAILGSLIPALVKNKSVGMSILYGLVLGFVIGLLCAAVGAYMIADVETISSAPIPDTAKWWSTYWKEFFSLGYLTTPYSSLWITGYAFLRSGSRGRNATPQIQRSCYGAPPNNS